MERINLHWNKAVGVLYTMYNIRLLIFIVGYLAWTVSQTMLLPGPGDARNQQTLLFNNFQPVSPAPRQKNAKVYAAGPYEAMSKETPTRFVGSN